MSRELALLLVCCGQGTEQKKGLAGHSHVPRVDNLVSLQFQDLRRSQREGKGWPALTVAVRKETSTV